MQIKFQILISDHCKNIHNSCISSVNYSELLLYIEQTQTYVFLSIFMIHSGSFWITRAVIFLFKLLFFVDISLTWSMISILTAFIVCIHSLSVTEGVSCCQCLDKSRQIKHVFMIPEIPRFQRRLQSKMCRHPRKPFTGSSINNEHDLM